MQAAIEFSALPRTLDSSRRLELAAEAGFSGLTLTCANEDLLTRAFAEEARDAGLRLFSLGVPVEERLSLSSTNEEVREAAVAEVAVAVQNAAKLGARAVTFAPGSVSADVDYAAALELSAKSLRELVPVAREAEVSLLVHNPGTHFLLSPLEFRDYLAPFPTSLVGFSLFPEVLRSYGYPHQWIKTLGSRLGAVHLYAYSPVAAELSPSSSPSVDWSRMLNALRGIAYQGYLAASPPSPLESSEDDVMALGADLLRLLQPDLSVGSCRAREKA